MHEDEIASDVALVRRLLAEQCPQWADLSLDRVPSTGTDNALYRFGADLVARLPLRPSAVPAIEREHRWLPVLAPQLPLAVPVPAARGAPTPEFPWPWSVYPWLAGDDAASAPCDRSAAAVDLARFLLALQRVDPTGGPTPGAANFGRGLPLASRDRDTRRGIVACRGLIDVDGAVGAWDDALAAPAWSDTPRWIHGDIAPGNLLVQDGRVSAVIDWEALAVGDPACDVMVAWELLDPDGRAVFRAELGVDAATWARGRGWALSTAVIALPYYRDTNPFMVEQALRKIEAVLGDSP